MVLEQRFIGVMRGADDGNYSTIELYDWEDVPEGEKTICPDSGRYFATALSDFEGKKVEVIIREVE